jgi:hypothetical protein
VRKRLAEVVQLLQVYARPAELEIGGREEAEAGQRDAAGRHGRAPKGGPRARQRDKSRGKSFMGRSQAIGEDPRAVLKEMGG